MARRPPADVERKRALARERGRRHRARQRASIAVGHFEISEELAQSLVWRGDATDAEAMFASGVENGVARVLKRYVAEARTIRNSASVQRLSALLRRASGRCAVSPAPRA